MPDNIGIAAFVFGAVLTLIAIVSGKFKIFGAEISERTGFIGRSFAGFLGMVFLMVGLVASLSASPDYASESRSNWDNGRSVPESANGSVPPIRESETSGSRKRGADERPDLVKESEGSALLKLEDDEIPDVSGYWYDPSGTVYETIQDGSEFEFTGVNMSTGVVTAGEGEIVGGRASIRFRTTNVSTGLTSTGSGSIEIQTNGQAMNGRFDDSVVGSYTNSFRRR